MAEPNLEYSLIAAGILFAIMWGFTCRVDNEGGPLEAPFSALLSIGFGILAAIQLTYGLLMAWAVWG